MNSRSTKIHELVNHFIFTPPALLTLTYLRANCHRNSLYSLLLPSPLFSTKCIHLIHFARSLCLAFFFYLLDTLLHRTRLTLLFFLLVVFLSFQMLKHCPTWAGFRLIHSLTCHHHFRLLLRLTEQKSLLTTF